MIPARTGAAFPGAGSTTWPRVPRAWSTSARAARRAQRSLALVRALRTSSREDVRDRPPERSQIFALSRLFAEICAVHDWRIRVSGPIPAGPVVLVANHVSYLDPVVLVGL